VTLYLDSSIPLRVLLRQRGQLPTWAKWERAFSSEILGLEIRRVLDRLRLQGQLAAREVATLLAHTATVEATISVVALTRTVLRRATLPMATPVRTLDAIHLVTALMVRERTTDGQLVFATHDARQASAAEALGFPVVGVG
jgi:predicted nucleic acid-binding protein